MSIFKNNLTTDELVRAKEGIGEYYRRIGIIWNQYSNSIITSSGLLSTANFAAYSLLFGKNQLSLISEVFLLLLLLLVNFVLTIGLWRHIHMQDRFGERILEIDKDIYKIDKVQFDHIPIFKDAGNAYKFLSILLIAANLIVIIFLLSTYCCCHGCCCKS